MSIEVWTIALAILSFAIYTYIGWQSRVGDTRGFFVADRGVPAIAHDLYYRIFNPAATETRRLMVGRVMVGFAIVVAGYFGINPPGFVAEVVAFAFGLAAASFFPVLVLGIFDQRTNKEGVIAGMIAGLVFTLVYITGVKFYGMTPWFFGVSAEGIGTLGMLINFAITLVVSRLTPPPPAEIQAMVVDIRNPEEA